MLKLLKNNKGYTLIELIVVIIILGLLIALIAPKLSNVKDKAKEMAFKAEIRTIEQGVQLFMLDYPNQSVVWESFAGQKADKSVEITDKNLHDTWNMYFEKYPTDPTREIPFRIEIFADGEVEITPNEPAGK